MLEPIRLETRITPDVLDLRRGQPDCGRCPDALLYAVPDMLRRLYADAHALGRPYSYGSVGRWTMTFERDSRIYYTRPDLQDMHLLRVEAEVSEHRLPITAGQMEADIMSLLMTRRDDVDE